MLNFEVKIQHQHFTVILYFLSNILFIFISGNQY
jgi:hypothetical protein